MTVSYKPTQDQDPQEPGSQYSSDGAPRGDNVAGTSFSAPLVPVEERFANGLRGALKLAPTRAARFAAAQGERSLFPVNVH